MHIWDEELRHHIRNYVRKGSKENRNRQVDRIMEFLAFTNSKEKITGLQRLGDRHVLMFWSVNRDFSENTAYEYWLAICKLWQWLGKPKKPPEPLTKDELEECRGKRAAANLERRKAKGGAIREQPAAGPYHDFKSVLVAAMDTNKVSYGKAANITGIFAGELEALLSVSGTGDFKKLFDFMAACGIAYSIKPLPDVFLSRRDPVANIKTR